VATRLRWRRACVRSAERWKSWTVIVPARWAKSTDAVKIARIYLSALSPIVWQPDAKTLERREVFSAYQAVVKESTRAKQQLRSMLNEHCVRLEKGFRLCHPNAITRLLKLREWTPARRMLLQQLHSSLVAARARRTLLRRHMAQEIVADDTLMRSSRLCGINLITLYGVVAAVGDVHRFTHSKKLVAYLGLNPSVSQSGNFQGSGALKRHGRGALRIQSGKKLLEVNNPLQKWDWRWRLGADATKPPWPSRANSALLCGMC
jgi:transposase